MPWWYLSLFVLAGSAVAAAAAKAPTFSCTDGEGAKSEIWIGQGPNRMKVTLRGRAREIRLSGPNVANGSNRPNQVLAYNGWNGTGSDIFQLMDVGTEFSTHYVVENGTSRVRVGLVLDHQERLGLNCHTTGAAVTVIPVEKELSAAGRFAELVGDASILRNRKGLLQPVGVLRLEGAFRRMSLSSALKDPRERARFVELAGTSLKNIDPRSLAQIRARLPKPMVEYVNRFCEEIGYKYYPESTRYSSWIKEGARPGYDDYSSVTAGFNAFVRAPSYLDKDIKAFFVAEVTPALRQIKEADVVKIKPYLNKEADPFFEALWGAANGKRTVADFPRVMEVVRDLASVVDAKDFDAMKVQRKLSSTYKVLLPYSPEEREAFFKAAAPHFRKLSARQKEDLAGWMDEEPQVKQLYQDLIR